MDDLLCEKCQVYVFMCMHVDVWWALVNPMQFILQIQWILVNLKQFVLQEYGGLMSLAD